MHPLFHYAEIRIKSSGRLIHIRKRLFHDKERTFYRFCCLYFSGDAYCQATTVTFSGYLLRGGIWVNITLFPLISAGPSFT